MNWTGGASCRDNGEQVPSLVNDFTPLLTKRSRRNGQNALVNEVLPLMRRRLSNRFHRSSRLHRTRRLTSPSSIKSYPRRSSPPSLCQSPRHPSSDQTKTLSQLTLYSSTRPIMGEPPEDPGAVATAPTQEKRIASAPLGTNCRGPRGVPLSLVWWWKLCPKNTRLGLFINGEHYTPSRPTSPVPSTPLPHSLTTLVPTPRLLPPLLPPTTNGLSLPLQF